MGTNINQKLFAKITIAVIFTLTLIISCNTAEPPDNRNFTLSLEDVSCTEAWLKLTTNNLTLPAEINTIITDEDGNSTSKISILNTQDSLLYIDSLLPNQTYKLYSTIHPNNQSEIKSNELSITTMDTTSNNFTWQTFTFGDGSESSFLYDLSIVDENNIWCVGEIYLRDSLGNIDSNPYNAIHWDGQKWDVTKIAVDYKGNKTIAPLLGIFILLDGKIILSSGLPYLPNENGGWKLYHLWDIGILTINDGSVNHIFGDVNNLFFAGNNGTIVEYSNSSWHKIESGTSSIINDIWGIQDNQNNTILYCPVSSFFVPGDKKILKIINNKVDSVSWNKDVRLYSAWAKDENFLYVCGEGVFANKFGIWTQMNTPQVGTNSIRGNDINDIFVVGDYGYIIHFNGVSWKVLSNSFDKGYSKVSVKGNVVIVCGNYLGKAFVEIGKRN